MAIDTARIADIPRLVELRLAYLMEDGGVSPEEAARIQRDLPDYLRRHLDRDMIGFVAREGDDIPACALLLLAEMPMSPAFINGKTGTVLNVYTKPEHRGRGYARRLMERLMDEAKRLEISRLELKATEMGYELYQSLGFEDGASGHRLMQWRPAKR